MSQIQSSSRQSCVLLDVLRGKHTDKRTPPRRLGLKAKRLRPPYPFRELSSSGRLEVHTLFNPTPEQFLEAQRVVQPLLHPRAAAGRLKELTGINRHLLSKYIRSIGSTRRYSGGSQWCSTFRCPPELNRIASKDESYVGIAAEVILPMGRGFMELSSPVPDRFYLGGSSSPLSSLGALLSLLGFKTR